MRSNCFSDDGRSAIPLQLHVVKGEVWSTALMCQNTLCLFQRGGRIMLTSWPRGSQAQLRCPAVDHDARWNVWRWSTQLQKRTRVFKVKEKRYEFLSSAGYTCEFQVFISYSNYILCGLIDEVSNILTNVPNYTHVRAPDYLQTDGSTGLIVVCVFTPTDRLNGPLSVAPGH